MKCEMTPRERLLTAIDLGKPDHVPVIPDISNMIPAKLTGKPFWEIYRGGSPTLYEAYCRAVEYFGFDGWYQAYDAVALRRAGQPEWKRQSISQLADRMVDRLVWDTADGELWEEIVYPIDNPPTVTVKKIKETEADFKKVRHFYGPVVSHDTSRLEPYRRMCGERGIFTLVMGYPGMHYWCDWFQGGLEAAVYAQADYPGLFDEWEEMARRAALEEAEILLDCRPDVLLLGGSGTLTLSTPDLVRRYALPTIRAVCKMARQAGIPTMLHSCGRSMELLDMLVNETALCCINPLEAPPMGDVNLAQVKKQYGDRICLMGNLHTTEVMLHGTEDEVEAAAKQAIDDAGTNGGFLLSTGDQCGRDTPEANIRRLVAVAQTYGRYYS